jgi:hypothetical protein
LPNWARHVPQRRLVASRDDVTGGNQFAVADVVAAPDTSSTSLVAQSMFGCGSLRGARRWCLLQRRLVPTRHASPTWIDAVTRTTAADTRDLTRAFRRMHDAGPLHLTRWGHLLPRRVVAAWHADPGRRIADCGALFDRGTDDRRIGPVVPTCRSACSSPAASAREVDASELRIGANRWPL